MSLFTSVRERRLWLGAAAASLGIIAGLLLSGALAARLGETGAGAGLFAAGFALLLLAVVTHGVAVRPRAAEGCAALALAAVVFLCLARVTTPAERTHLLEYGALALFVYEALRERRLRGGRALPPAAAALLAATLAGGLDEAVQLFLPGRVFSLRDLGFNFLAAAAAVGSTAGLRRARSAASRRRRPEAETEP